MLIEIEVEDAAWTAALADVEALCRRAAAAAGPEGGVNILLTDDTKVHDLNLRFLGKDAATNVLAFPAVATLDGELGDIALAFGVCAREAVAQGKSLADHTRHLVIHGVLHLMGYDHQDDAEAQAMEDLERKLLTSLGVSDPYATVDV